MAETDTLVSESGTGENKKGDNYAGGVKGAWARFSGTVGYSSRPALHGGLIIFMELTIFATMGFGALSAYEWTRDPGTHYLTSYQWMWITAGGLMTWGVLFFNYWGTNAITKYTCVAMLAMYSVGMWISYQLYQDDLAGKFLIDSSSVGDNYKKQMFFMPRFFGVLALAGVGPGAGAFIFFQCWTISPFGGWMVAMKNPKELVLAIAGKIMHRMSTNRLGFDGKPAGSYEAWAWLCVTKFKQATPCIECVGKTNRGEITGANGDPKSDLVGSGLIKVCDHCGSFGTCCAAHWNSARDTHYAVCQSSGGKLSDAGFATVKKQADRIMATRKHNY